MIRPVTILNYFRQRDRGRILFLLALVCFLYLPFLGSPFFFDDLSFFNGPAARYYAEQPFRFDLRWLPNASLGRTWEWVDSEPHLLRLPNMLLHAANALLIFSLMRRLLGATLPAAEQAKITQAAWFGALIFACHPLAVYATGYIVQRNTLMATTFTLLMLLGYLQGLLSGKKRWIILAVLSFVLAGFSKEHSVMMPAVLVAMTILLRDKIRLDRRSLWLGWIAFAGFGIVLVLISKGLLGTDARGPVFEPMGSNSLGQVKLDADEALLPVLSAFTQAGLFFKYLFLWFVPNPAWMSIDMREPFVTGLNSWRGWAGAIAFVAYGLTAVSLLFRRGMSGLLGFALLYPWLMFWVEFSSVRMQEIFVLYRSYLWMPGLMLPVALAPLKWPGRRTIMALSLAVVVLTAFAWNRLWVFADNYRLWNDAALLLGNDKIQGADRIFYNRATSASEAKKPGEAIADLESAVSMSPQLAPLHHELAVAYFNAVRYQDALTQIDLAIRIDPQDARYYYAKGIIFKRLHQDDQAMRQMQKSCELKNAVACMIVGLFKDKK